MTAADSGGAPEKTEQSGEEVGVQVDGTMTVRVKEEAPEEGQSHAQGAELWVVHRWEAEETLEKVQGQWSDVVVE